MKLMIFGFLQSSSEILNFSEAMFYENYLTSDFHTNTVISGRVCQLVKMASKIVLRPMLVHHSTFLGGLYTPNCPFKAVHLGGAS